MPRVNQEDLADKAGETEQEDFTAAVAVAEAKKLVAERAGAPLAGEGVEVQAALVATSPIAVTGFGAMTGGALSASYDEDALFEQPDVSIRGNRFPHLRLAAGQTKEVQDAAAHPGEWVLEGSQSFKRVIFFPGRYWLSRMLSERTPNGPGEVLCRAERIPVRKNGPELFGVGIPGGPCAECPMSKWGARNEVTGKGTPPPCRLIHIFEGVSLTHEQRVEIRLKSTAEKLAGQIVNLIATEGMGQFLLELGSEKKSNAGNQIYHVPTAQKIRATPEHMKTAREIHTREMEAQGLS